MEIEVLVRWSRLKAPELEKIDEETAQLIRLGLKDEPNQEREVTVEHEYGLMTLNLEDISMFNQLDKEHTVIRTPEGIFNIKCTYRNLKYIKEFFSGKLIRNVSDFGVDQHLLAKTAKVNKIMNGLSDTSSTVSSSDLPPTTTEL